MANSGAVCIQVLNGHTSDVTFCDFSGSILATSSNDKTVRLWAQDNDGQFAEVCFSPLCGHTYGVNCVRFSPFGTVLASCSTDGTIIFWNTQTGVKAGELKHPSGSAIRVCCFAPSSAVLATGGDDERIVLWDISTKTEIRVLEGHEAMVTAVSFTPDSSYLASGSTGGDIMLWDARFGHGRCLAICNMAHDLGILGCDFSPQYEASAGETTVSCRYLLATCGNDDLVKLWHVKTGILCTITLCATLEGQSGNIMSCRFSTNGKLLASTAGDKSIVIWDPYTGQMLQKLEKHIRYVISCAFSINNKLLASGSNDKTVSIWSLDNSKLYEAQCPKESTGSHYLVSNQGVSVISQWSSEEVCSWLVKIGLGEYADIFRTHDIDGRELLHINHECLVTVMKIDTLGHRNKILRGIQALKNPLWQHNIIDSEDVSIPEEFYCPITHEVMKNPVVAADGYSYEGAAIAAWMKNGQPTSPMTNEILSHTHLVPNRALHILIQKHQLQ